MKTLVIAGGVGAHKALRARLQELGDQLEVEVCYPRIEFCTDNGAMIAFAGCQRLLAGERAGLVITTQARWDMQDLDAPQVAV